MSNVEMRPHKQWKLVLDEKPLPGSWNMAVDDFLFRSLSDEPETYLRFYRWERPTVSVGFFQNIRKVVDFECCQKNGIDIVRRMTGGKLVLHHKEATYSLCSSDTETFTPTLKDSYRLISEALILGLEKMGLKPCLADAPPDSYVKGNLPCFSFPARNEIEITGRKIVGSAQKRTGLKFIQHGSIPLDEDQGLLEAVSNLGENENRVRMISLSQAMNRKVDFDWTVERLITGFTDFFGVSLKPKVMSNKERDLISKIQEEQYSNPEWTFSRVGP